MAKELTKKQIQQHDYVDNRIHHMLCNLNPKDEALPWDIKIISEIREKVAAHFKKTIPGFDEKKFYAWID